MAFNTDKNISHALWAQESVLRVTSIFRTLQGEGPLAGRPSVFIRFAGCNFGEKTFACQFCDTNFKVEGAKQHTADELLEEVRKIAQPTDWLVLTGGEPTVQPVGPMADLIDQLLERGIVEGVQFETNGSNSSMFEQLSTYCIEPMIVVSPKAINGNYADFTGKNILDLAHCLKFVVDADPASPHHTVPQWAHVAPCAVYISPITVYKRAPDTEVASIWDATLVDAQATQRNYEYAAAYVLNNPGFILSLQTHLFTAIP